MSTLQVLAREDKEGASELNLFSRKPYVQPLPLPHDFAADDLVPLRTPPAADNQRKADAR